MLDRDRRALRPQAPQSLAAIKAVYARPRTDQSRRAARDRAAYPGCSTSPTAFDGILRAQTSAPRCRAGSLRRSRRASNRCSSTGTLRHTALRHHQGGHRGSIAPASATGDGCVLKPRCCPNTPARKIPRDLGTRIVPATWRAAWQDTPAYERSWHRRKKVEMLFAHLKRILRLGRLRLRGPRVACDEF
ncbi:MAG: transposase, partial [Devosia sp.]|nr:transposase [Devosia sp.]